MKLKSEPRLTWLTFLSNIGGVLGLCIGISIVSIVEIVWILMRALMKIVL
jgi:hypothetical protein